MLRLTDVYGRSVCRRSVAMYSHKTCSNVHVRAALQQWCLQGLALGLANPTGFERWYRSIATSDDSRRVVTSTSLSDFFATSDISSERSKAKHVGCRPHLPSWVALVRSHGPEL